MLRSCWSGARIEKVFDYQIPPKVALTRSRFISGIRGLETAIYEVGSYPFVYIGPIFIIWQAVVTTSRASQPQPTEVSPTASIPRGKRKRKQAKKSNGWITFF